MDTKPAGWRNYLRANLGRFSVKGRAAPVIETVHACAKHGIVFRKMLSNFDDINTDHMCVGCLVEVVNKYTARTYGYKKAHAHHP